MYWCPYPFVNETCFAAYNIESFVWVLNADEFKTLKQYATLYKVPGYEIVNCPLLLYPIDSKSSKSICNAEILVERNMIKNAVPGLLVLQCNKNGCNNKFCYHCRAKIATNTSKCDLCFFLKKRVAQPICF